jgi:Ca-activated chloride channel family protein
VGETGSTQPIPSGAGDPDVVTVPGLGLLSLSGFENPVWLALLVAPAALVAVYLVANERRRQRMRRFADPLATDSVAPVRSSRWRHLPVALMLLALVPLTIALAQPSHDVRVPRDRAVIMLVIDVSQSMRATDVPPNRLIAAQHAAQQFTKQVTSGVNLGLIAFAGSANVLVAPSPDHSLTVAALDKLAPADSTATGQAIFAALQSIHTVNAVLKGPQDKPPPARIVLLSDGKENKPGNPDNPQGAYTAARAARDQGVPITTIAFGTAAGHVAMENETVQVPVDDGMMKTIARLSGGQTSSAENIDELNKDFSAVEDQMGYQVESGPASAGWLRIAVMLCAVGALLGLLINRRLPV